MSNPTEVTETVIETETTIETGPGGTVEETIETTTETETTNP
jgi:hypothetical protein